MADTNFRVTSEWIMAHRTPALSWLRVQLEILGVPYPPVAGWIDRVEGKRLTEEQRQRFETEGALGAKKYRKAAAAALTPSLFDERDRGVCPACSRPFTFQPPPGAKPGAICFHCSRPFHLVSNQVTWVDGQRSPAAEERIYPSGKPHRRGGARQNWLRANRHA